MTLVNAIRKCRKSWKAGQVPPLNCVTIFSRDILISTIDKKAVFCTDAGKFPEFLQTGKKRLVECHAGFDFNGIEFYTMVHEKIDFIPVLSRQK